MQRGVFRVVSFVVLASVIRVAFPEAARAESITLPSSMQRKQRFRSASQLPNWVSRSDCLARDVLTFSPVTLQDYLGYDLEVWAGNSNVDCADPDNRADGGSCFQVYAAKANSATMKVQIDALDLVARGAANPDYPDVYNGAASKKRTALDLTFLLIDADGNVGGKPKLWTDIGYDVSPPSPPTALSASESETRIYLDWTAPDDLDLKSYRFYCDPARGSERRDGGLSTLGAVSAVSQAESTDAGGGQSDAAKTDGEDGGRSNDRCSESDLIAAGVDPTTTRGLDEHVCGGSATADDHTGTVDHLVNGVDYSLAVAAVDEIGNVSVLSRPVCETPIPVTDFFELYRQAGGKAGGGFCSLSRAPNATSRCTTTLFAGLLLCAAMRRKRRLS
jgi:hypothetical protein